jgi:2-phospho-L-lactate/phosphoenolpyruvate guanylyltransferase
MAPDVDLEAARPATLNWSLVIPVKVLAQAKSRLTGLPGQRRSDVALAMAADTVAAAIRADAVAAVLVITDDQAVRAVAASLGAVVLADAPAAGLNEAFAHGAAYSAGKWPERGLAGLAGDLPALRPPELTAALAAAARLGSAFVPDADGTGTTLYAVAPGQRFRPQFGPASRDRHLAAGAVEITATADSDATGLVGLRRDVDTVDDLRAAAKIGLGERTAALLAAGSWL